MIRILYRVPGEMTLFEADLTTTTAAQILELAAELRRPDTEIIEWSVDHGRA